MTHRYDDILAFLEVVKAGSFTAAAERLKLSKSVVSDRVRALEDALGVELLRRSTRQVTPTDRGREFFDSLSPLVQQLEQAVEQVSAADGPLTGHLRITAPMTFGTMHLSPVVASFAKLHPALEIALDLDDRVVDILDAGYDLAVRIGRLENSALRARKLCDSRRVVCCSPAYARRVGQPASVAELAEHQCIDYANVHAGRLWRFEPRQPGGKTQVVETRSRLVANNGEVMRDMAVAGLGIAILPLFIVAEQLRRKQLIQVLPDEVPLADSLYAVYRPTRHMPRKLRDFIDHLVAAFAAAPWSVRGD